MSEWNIVFERVYTGNVLDDIYFNGVGELYAIELVLLVARYLCCNHPLITETEMSFLRKFTSQFAPKFVILRTYSADSCAIFVKVTTFPFHLYDMQKSFLTVWFPKCNIMTSYGEFHIYQNTSSYLWLYSLHILNWVSQLFNLSKINLTLLHCS